MIQRVILIYPQYTDGGLVPITALEELGLYVLVEIFKTAPTENIDVVKLTQNQITTRGKFYSCEIHNDHRRQTLSPDMPTGKTTNKFENKDGFLIKVVLISSWFRRS